MIIAPLKQFLVDLQLNNPSDTDTHYVRAVIKNAVSGVIIDTINLTDNGSGYFSKLWTTPADQSGTGLQIKIFKTVYDDSGYTSQSLVYGTVLENYIVRDLPGLRSTFGGAAATSSSISYEEIEKIIRKVLEELPQPEKVVVPDHSKKIITAIDALGKKMGSLAAALKAKNTGKEKGIEDLKEILLKYSEAQEKLVSHLTNTVDKDLFTGITESLVAAIEGLQDKNVEKFLQLTKAVQALTNKSTITKLMPEEVKPETEKDPAVEKEVKPEFVMKKIEPRAIIQKLLSFSTI